MKLRHIEARPHNAFGEHPLERQAREEAKAAKKNGYATVGWWSACGRFITYASHGANKVTWSTGKWVDTDVPGFGSRWGSFSVAEQQAEYARVLPHVTCLACRAKLKERAEQEAAEASAFEIAKALS